MEITSPESRRTLIDRTFAFIDALPTSDRLLVRVLAVVFVGAAVWLAIAASTAALVSIPDRGGVLREGIVGTPRFINPILAVTSADQDLSALVHAGIMRRDATGELVPHIAESITVSEDGRIYTVTIRDDVFFHDGEQLTTDDIIFTIASIQDPAVKSPLRASWEGISTERISEYDLHIILPEPYTPFIENLTLGILPEHIWRSATAEELPFSQYNSEPIGAGPYTVSTIKRTTSGIPELYELVPHRAYFGETPKIARLVMQFYPTEERLLAALTEGTIDSAGGLSHHALASLSERTADITFTRAPLPRTFALFLNQNEQPLFRSEAVRKALALTAPRDQIIADVLSGYGRAITSPIPPGFGIETATPPESERGALDEARALLRADGWRINEETGLWQKEIDDTDVSLSFSIATANTPLFEQTARVLVARWEALGIPVSVRQFDTSDLSQTIIRPRQYDALLFGTVVGRELDLFSFWHSSQRNDPGLNVALYTNITTDALLSRLRTTSDRDERQAILKEFNDEVVAEAPAVFLYTPEYVYVTAPHITGVSLTGIASGSERFSTIESWHIATDAVWPIFVPEKMRTEETG